MHMGLSLWKHALFSDESKILCLAAKIIGGHI